MAALVGAPSLVGIEKTIGFATSSLVGETVRVKFPLQCATPLKGLQVVALRDGKSNGEKPWDTQKAFLLAKDSATETSAVATTDFIVGRTFGYALESEEEESDVDEDAEVLHVDNESMDDADQLDISRLGIPAAVTAALEKRGITQLFPIQVTRP